MKNLYYITIIGLLLLSCNRTKQSESAEIPFVVNQNSLFAEIQEDTNQDGSSPEKQVDITQNSAFFEIPVDIDQNYSLPLSEIAEEITAIELEMTDESLINPDNIQRIFISENHIITVETSLVSGATAKILVFNKDGKFLNRIGSRGQGPGEYTMITNVALDEKNKRLFIANFPNKIICYDLNGKFLKESTLKSSNTVLLDIKCINDEVLLLVNNQTSSPEFSSNTILLFRLNDDFQVIDSSFVRKNIFKSRRGIIRNFTTDYILKGNPSVFLYYSEIYPKATTPPVEKVIRDTLYRFEDNQLVPELKLKFRNDGIDGGGSKFIHLFNIYRSSQYIFAFYFKDNGNSSYYFCYDTKTGQGYNMQDGYTDDIHNIETPVKIRPLNLNTEMFYYWHTHMDPDDIEEPNPTIYIGTLKK